MKILHVLDHSRPLTSGYAFRSHYILTWQKKIGLSPFGLTSPLYNQGSGWEEVEGVSYFRIKLPPICLKFPILREWSTILALKRAIKRLALETHPEIIHAHSPSLCGYAAVSVGRKLNIPVVYEIRAFWEDAAVDQGKFSYHSFPYRLYRAFETLVVKKAWAVVTICEGLKRDLIARGIPEEKIFVVPNAVDLKRFKPLEPDLELKKRLGLEGVLVVGFIGSFYRFEGLDLLIQAVAQLNGIKALLVGAGEKYNELKKLVKDLKLESKIIMPGRVPHQEVHRYYSIMDIMVYPRRRERVTELVTPLKPLEAMAHGKIVIGSDVGGIKEIIGEGKEAGGLLFKAEQVDDLTAKLKEVLQNPLYQAELRKRAKNWVRKRDWGIIIKKYRKIYQSFIRNLR